MESYNSVLNNVVYLDIETTGLDPGISEIIEIGAVKIKGNKAFTYQTLIKPTSDVPVSIYNLCAGLKEEDLKSAPKINEIAKDFISFIEDLPLICHNGKFEEKFLQNKFPSINNMILDSMELAAILEPFRKEYNLETLLYSVTTIKKQEDHRGLQDSIDTMKVVNSLLCRLWSTEDKRNGKKTLYKALINEYYLKNKWNWVDYIEKPHFLDYDKYPYVNYNSKIVLKNNNNHMDIDFTKYEELLKNNSIWNSGNEFVYQFRNDQLNISNKIRVNYEKGERIFIEAPTGCGKTFSYLLIASICAYLNKENKRYEDSSFVISTDTKELQNQLIDKDIPNILSKLGLIGKINYGAIKGKSNYLCPIRLNSYTDFYLIDKGTLAEVFLRRLASSGEYGDTENISYWAYKHFNLDHHLSSVSCDSENCNLDKCAKLCFLRKRYNELPQENITVVNHSLLSTWPYAEKKKIFHLIIDEAHNLMEKSYEFFSEEFNSFELIDTLQKLQHGTPSIVTLYRKINMSYGYRENIDVDEITKREENVRFHISMLIKEMISMNLSNGTYNFSTEFMLPRDEMKDSIHKLKIPIDNLRNAILGLYMLLNTYITNILNDGDPYGDNDYKAIITYINKLKVANDTIDNFLAFSNEQAKILEIDSDFRYFILKITPLNVGQLVNDIILKEVKSTTFLSATLRINNSFSTVKSHLGQQRAKEYKVNTIFDLKNKTKVFTLSDVGSYKSEKFVEKITKFIYEASTKLSGHSLILFNNNKRREAVAAELCELVKGTRIEVHTNKKAIQYLKDKNRKVIILGSKGFFEGIDLPGDALTLVMMDKLPNYNPDYPLLKAITTYQNKRYHDVNYPQLCIKMKQSYGRLIRTTMDYGYFVILDGGDNINTLNRIQNDLGGPPIVKTTTKDILNLIDTDYKIWRSHNLKCLLTKVHSSNKEIKDEFNIESQKSKSFWEFSGINPISNEMYFRFGEMNVKIPNVISNKR